MKKIFGNTWVQILFFGALVGSALILLDNKGVFTKKTDEKPNYEGPITVDKSKTYFTQASFSELGHDFGKVKEGDSLSHVFKIINNGKEPLVIYKGVGSCECVAATLKNEMVAPGGAIEITAHFNTKGRKGVQNRSIVFTCNTEPAEMTYGIKAIVE
jgi:hypothetical protein